ncbi:MAG: sulfotransferase domain-containing protein [Bacteroidetes bacterium]|nr:sulfotransferase domain-containing protein [Bacteroidota bacterium]
MLRQINTIFSSFNKITWNDIHVNIIVSTGRTGTEFLARFFNEGFRGVYALHEPVPDLYDLGVDYIKKKIVGRRAVMEFKKDREKICHEVHRRNCNVYVESNTNLWCLIPLFRRIFKQYKIVCVIRDGRDYVRSCYSKIVESKTGGKTLFIEDDDSRTRIKAIDFKDDPYYSQWGDMDRFERLCWHWVKKNTIMVNHLENEKKVLVVKFEEIFNSASGFPGLNRIIDFCGIQDRRFLTYTEYAKRMSSRVNANSSYELPSWKNWDESLKKKFDQIAGKSMRQLGYL